MEEDNRNKNERKRVKVAPTLWTSMLEENLMPIEKEASLQEVEEANSKVFSSNVECNFI